MVGVRDNLSFQAPVTGMKPRTRGGIYRKKERVMDKIIRPITHRILPLDVLACRAFLAFRKVLPLNVWEDHLGYCPPAFPSERGI
jgi:hypothetical protein|uniref:Uncharacterized protein n=2 Tax=Picea TaxID=3328 RepID=A0A101M087_PICGL|nr:hypothetical protein ABT39_MTgene4542 [Picea glauca]QHR92730.1 hypothetical protein Q903MT_gene6778 [Picea sitchensis]